MGCERRRPREDGNDLALRSTDKKKNFQKKLKKQRRKQTRKASENMTYSAHWRINDSWK